MDNILKNHVARISRMANAVYTYHLDGKTRPYEELGFWVPELMYEMESTLRLIDRMPYSKIAKGEAIIRIEECAKPVMRRFGYNI